MINFQGTPFTICSAMKCTCDESRIRKWSAFTHLITMCRDASACIECFVRRSTAFIDVVFRFRRTNKRQQYQREVLYSRVSTPIALAMACRSLPLNAHANGNRWDDEFRPSYNNLDRAILERRQSYNARGSTRFRMGMHTISRRDRFIHAKILDRTK